MSLTASKTAKNYKTQEERKAEAEKAKKEKERANDTKTK